MLADVTCTPSPVTAGLGQGGVTTVWSVNFRVRPNGLHQGVSQGGHSLCIRLWSVKRAEQSPPQSCLSFCE